MLAVLIVIAALGIAIFVVAIYNPVATGQVGAHDNHLLMEIGRDETADPGWEMYVYEFHANTSYYTAFSVRNEGPIAVTVLGLDRSRNVELVPYADPVELRLGTPAGESGGLTEWQASRPLTQTILQPGKELSLWVRWEIGPCAPDEPTPHEADYFLARQSVPLRWSILGVARTTSIKLDYTVAFAVTEKNVRTQCEAGTLLRKALADA
jgi:hypothetical protein